MLAAILDTDPDARPDRRAARRGRPTGSRPTRSCCSGRSCEYVRRPGEADPPVGAVAARARRRRRRSAGCGSSPTSSPSRCPARSAIADAHAPAARLRDEVDRPAARCRRRPAPRTPWNRPITPHRRFAYTTIPLEDAKKVRRADGCTFNDVVMALCSGTLRRYLIEHDCLPDESLIAMVPVSVRTRRRGRQLPEPGVGAARRPGHQRARSRRRGCARVQQSMTTAKAQLRGDPGRDAAGLHPVRPAGDRRPGDADVQPAAHRRPHEPAVQPDHLQRARAGDPAVLGRRPARALLPDLGAGRRPGPQHDRAELQRQPRLRLRRLPRAGARRVATDRLLHESMDELLALV